MIVNGRTALNVLLARRRVNRVYTKNASLFYGICGQVAGNGIQRVGKTTPGADPDGVIDLVKVSR